MRFNIFKNPYKASLEKSAKLVAPDDKSHEKMLGAVMTTVGVVSAVSFAAASAKAAALAKAAAAKTAGTAVATVVGVTAVSVAGASMIIPPTIADIRTQNIGWKQTEIIVKPGSEMTTQSVELLTEDGVPFILQKRDGSYVIGVGANGTYVIQITGQGGKRVSATVEINSIDDQLPVMERYETDEDTVTIYFFDQLSGVNWDSLSGLDASGAMVQPIRIDADRGCAVFALPETSMEVYLEDLAGNCGVSTITVKQTDG